MDHASRAGYLPTLDGWRAIAVLAVVLGHSVRWGCDAGPTPPMLCEAGGHGVSVFFAISGLLITSRLLREWRQHDRVSLRAFYVRRAYRILPPAMTYLAVVAVLAIAGTLVANSASIIAAATFIRDYPWWSDGLQWYTAHYWSLAVEEKFYLVWPALLIATSPRRVLPWAIGLAGAVLAWRLADGHWHFISGTLLPGYTLDLRWDTRLDAILWGCILGIALDRATGAAWLARRLTPLVEALLWIAFAVAIVLTTSHTRDMLTLETLIVPLLLASTVVHPRRPLGRVLEHPALRAIGVRSYGIYVWQQLFIGDVGVKPLPMLQRFPLNFVWLALVVMASYKWIEVPLIRHGYRVTAREATRPAAPLASAMDPS